MRLFFWLTVETSWRKVDWSIFEKATPNPNSPIKSSSPQFFQSVNRTPPRPRTKASRIANLSDYHQSPEVSFVGSVRKTNQGRGVVFWSLTGFSRSVRHERSRVRSVSRVRLSVTLSDNDTRRASEERLRKDGLVSREPRGVLVVVVVVD